MKKLLAAFAVLAASTMAQAQTLADHPYARNDRGPVVQVAEHGSQYRRAEHRRMKHYHRKHRRNHHG